MTYGPMSTTSVRGLWLKDSKFRTTVWWRCLIPTTTRNSMNNESLEVLSTGSNRWLVIKRRWTTDWLHHLESTPVSPRSPGYKWKGETENFLCLSESSPSRFIHLVTFNSLSLTTRTPFHIFPSSSRFKLSVIINNDPQVLDLKNQDFSHDTNTFSHLPT